MDRQELRKKELDFLEQEKKKYPDLFKKNTTVEDDVFLANYGIYIPGKNLFPKGFVKILPSDFIVEEITSSGHTSTIGFPSGKDDSKPVAANADAGIQNQQKNFSTYATLVKCGISTIEAVEDIAKKLGLGRQEIALIGYAGIKDKDAITSQEISFRNIPAQAVGKITSNEYFLKDIRPGKGMLAKGDLQKNKFTILVRSNDLDKDGISEIVSKQVKNVKENGFYNYYYLQRFGNPRLINFVWGIHIIKGEYRQAVEHYLSYPAPRELEYFRNMRKKIGENMGKWDEIEKMLNPFSLIFLTELKMVNYLRTRPTDYLGALLAVPDQALLWVYAVPSLLFNEKISNLLQRGKPVPPSLPLILSEKQSDIDVYREELQAIGLYPLTFNYLKPFRNIFIKSRAVATREPVEFHAFDVTKEGLVISFSLGKGEYATTFLSHIFNLATAGENEIENNTVDCKAMLGEKDTEKTMEFFAPIINQYREKE